MSVNFLLMFPQWTMLDNVVFDIQMFLLSAAPQYKTMNTKLSVLLKMKLKATFSVHSSLYISTTRSYKYHC